MKLQRQAGYAMAALLVGLSIMAVLATVAMPVWKQTAQREKEEELVFRGQQYARAIGLFQRKYANAFPPNIDVLVDQRFLRKKFKDPVTNDDFVPLLQGQQGATPGSGSQTATRPGQTTPSAQTAPASGQRGTGAGAGAGRGATQGTSPIGTPGGGPVGGIVGVTSKSKDKSIRIYNGRTHYNEWAFVYTPQVQAPGAAGVPGGIPGRGQRGQPGTNPFTPGGGGPGRGGPGRGGPGRGGPFGPGGSSPGPGSPQTPITPPRPGR